MPGAGKQPPEVQEHIKELLEAGFDPTTIHRRLKVGRSSIYRMKRCLQQHGTAYMPVELNKKNGRPKVLSTEQELVSCVTDFSSALLLLTLLPPFHAKTWSIDAYINVFVYRKSATGSAHPATALGT